MDHGSNNPSLRMWRKTAACGWFSLVRISYLIFIQCSCDQYWPHVCAKFSVALWRDLFSLDWSLWNRKHRTRGYNSRRRASASQFVMHTQVIVLRRSRISWQLLDSSEDRLPTCRYSDPTVPNRDSRATPVTLPVSDWHDR